MGNGKMKNRRRLAGLILWGLFIVMVAGVTYISFQNGEESKAMGKEILTTFAGIKESGDAAGQKRMDDLMYLLRQSGRVLAFLSIGMVGTGAIYLTCTKWGWLPRTGVTVFLLWAIACFTEKMKIFIPSRHYSHQEMMISIAASAAGFLLASLLILLGKVFYKRSVNLSSQYLQR